MTRFNRIALASRKPTSKNKRQDRRKQRGLFLEQLEDRKVFVVGAFEIPPIVTPGTGFDGVVALDFNSSSTPTTLNSGCTGSLLTTGRHIITAAHCVADNTGAVDQTDVQVVFEMADQHYVIDVDLTAAGVLDIAPGFNGDTGDGADMAIIMLPVIAPFPAERYQIYRGIDESNQLYVVAGYGLTGTGGDGQVTGGSDIKRLGHNEFGDPGDIVAGANGDILQADFDDGTAGNNVLGDTDGLDNGEAATGAGDSGSPAFLGGRLIAGINSFSGAGNVFGDIDSFTRVSDFTGFVDGVLDDPAAVVLDMNFQPAGHNGVPDVINAQLDPNDATRYQLLINGQEVWSDLLTRVTSISIVGSADEDTVVIGGTGGGNLITYTPTGPDSGTVAMAGMPTVTVTSAEHLSILGLGGTDTLTINAAATGPTIPDVHFNGGGQVGDNLVIVGNGNNHGVYRPDSGITGDGTVTVDEGLITFENLQPITVSGFFEFTVQTPNSVDVLTVDSPAAGQNRVSGTSGNIAIEAVTFFDIVHFEIDTATNDGPLSATGSNSINFTTDLVATLLASMTVRAGDGNDTVNATAVLTTPLTIYGGDGNDTLSGGGGGDRIFGGSGNDIIVGGGGTDFEYGEEGNDIFGNATLTPNAVADDAGADFAFGGEGFDNFVWEPGDGADQNNGGGDAADVFRFFGNAAANEFTLRQGGTPTHFNALIGAVVIDNHGIEDVIVDGLGGADSFTVNDLFATEVVSVNLNLGAADAAAVDPVTINGRNLADNVLLTSTGAGSVSIQGLRYNVNLINAEATDTLAVNGNQGDDTIAAASSLGGVILLRLNGNEGNDFLQGANGNDNFDGDSGDDTFVGGGGMDNVGAGAGSSVGDTILVAGTSGADTISLSLSATGQLIATVNGLTTTYANFIGGPIATSGIEQILVQGLAGNDSLTVDSTNGAIPILINFDGGNNADLLTLTGGTAESDTYTVGPNITEGTSTIVIGGVTQIVRFNALEPVIDLVAGSLTVNATNGNNAINYTQGGVAANGLVSIDGFETIEFSNKTTLTINALAGDDTINLNNPTTPTGLTGDITVNGGDPTASDILIFNSIAGTAEFISLNGTGEGAGTINLTTQPEVAYAGIEHLNLVMQSADDDRIGDLAGTAGVDTAEITPGATPGSGTITGMVNNNAFRRVPITFTGHSLTSDLRVFFVGGGADVLIINGTSGDDAFNVSDSATGDISTTLSVAGQLFLLVDYDFNNVPAQRAVIRGLDGDDTFTHDGDGDIAVTYEGGNPSSGSDTLFFNGTGTAVAIDLAAKTIRKTAAGELVTFTGIEDLDVSARGGTITVNGTVGPDGLTVTPTSANDATIEIVGDPLTIFTTNTAALNIDLLAGNNNKLTVVGTQAGENITATGALVTVGALKTVNYTNITALQVNGLAGSDVFDITPAATTTIFIDGGDPIGTTGDRLTLNPPGAFFIQPGPEKDEGGLVAAGTQRVSWDHIEEVIVNGGGPALVLGTNGDDDITIIARDDSTHAGTDGVQDFTVTVNDTFNVLYINQPALFVDALAGDDDIVVRAPAPNEVDWDVDVTLVGGPAASPTIDQGDVLEFETPGTNTVVFTPTGPETGTFLLDQAVNDSTLAFVSSFTFDPLGINYISSPGGIEHVVYDGVDPNSLDLLTINGTGVNDTLTYDTSIGSGSFRSAFSPTFDFSLEARVTFNGGGGFDVANLSSSAGNDTVTSTASEITVSTPGSVVIFTIGTGVERLNLSTLGGSDNIDLDLNVAGLQKSVDAGDGDDIVNLAGTIDATILGGTGNDFLTGSPAFDTIDGGSGRDVIFGIGGNDDILGGDGNDILVGGAGVDNVYGQDGADILVWNPGDGNDLFEGGIGQDILQFVGGAAADTFTVSANGTRLRIDRSPPAIPGQIIIDAAGMEQVDINTSISFGGTLTGAQEVPPVATAATGHAALVLNAATGTFEIEIVVQGITLVQLNNAHIHQGAVGVNGGVIFDLGTAGWSDVGGSIRRSLPLANFPTANIADLLAGNTYVNIHTVGNPGGAIRGQLTAVSGAPNLNGADTFTINDLFTTDVQTVNLGLGNADAAAIDGVTVNGRNVADNLQITAPNDTLQSHVLLTGLKYNVNVFGAVAADTDRLTVNGNNGDDTIKATNGVENTVLITLNGDAGNDTLSADAIINGGAGDDILFGGAGLDTISGNDGDDEIHVDFDGFTDVISGGNGYDRIVISGTPGNDIISAFQSNATTLISTLQSPPAAVVSDTDTIGTIEQVDILAGSGNDTIFVQHAEVLEDAPVNGVVFFVDGGAGFTGDRLIVQDNATGDLLLYRKADSGTEGSITVGPTNAEPLLTDFTNIEYVNPVAAAGGTVVVFKYDPYEFNNDRFNATTLGVGETLNADPVIDPGAIAGLPANFPGPVPQDEDWYRVQALYTGTLDVRLFFRHLATAPVNLPGNGDLDLQVTDSAGNVIDTDIDTTDNARVRIAAVQGEIYFLRVFGKAAGALNTYDVSVANETAPVPFDLELDDALFTGSDSGRSRFDNVTNITTPTIFLRVADHALLFDGPDNGAAPPAAAFDNVAGELFDIPFQASTATNAPGTGFRVAIFDTENNTHDPVPLGYATQVAGSPGVYTFTFNTPLAEGSHFLSARVEIIDGATAEQAQGFGDFASLSLEIIVDTTAPAAFFGFGPVVPGADGLHPDSDSGYDSQILTLIDRYTNDLTPTLWGEAEANANIFVFVDVDNDGVITGVDRFLGQTVAIPEDGGDQNPIGHWELTSIVSMDDLQLVTDLQANGVIAAGQINGPRRFLLAAEDLAGNFLDPADDMNIFIDTQGPQVAAVTVAGTPGYDLFDPKPSTDGPTPAVFALNIDFVDQPIRQNGNPIAIGTNSGLNQTLALSNGNYKLVGDHVGVVNIDTIGFQDFTLDGTIGQTTIQLNFFNALPDDRYTLTISDRIGDDAGNALDGNTNTVEPQENPLLFPSGDFNPGGDFVARFTVDSRPEIGVWATGSVWVDTNGNSEFDPKNTDFTNRDIVYQTGLVTDDVFAGNFVAAAFGVADRFDKLAAYGKVGANFRFSVDTDNDGVGDVVGSSATNPNGAPVSGNFNGFAGDGDEVGVWTGTSWFFDTDHDFVVGDAGNFVLTSALRGYGFTGDFDGDGFVDLATFKDDFFSFDLSSVGATLNANLPGLNGAVDRSFRFGQVGTRERPVAADMNLDGFDDIGLYQPDRTGVAPAEGSEWYWLVSGINGSVLNRVVFDPIIGAPVVNFTPTPFGNDIYQFFGEEFSDPIVGNFDPPVTPITSSSLNTFGRPYDIDLNGTIDIKDLMYVVYGFNLNESNQYARYADLDRNGTVSIADLLEMVFAYNEELAAKANGEGAAVTDVADDGDGYAAAVDDVLADESLFDEQMFALSGDGLGNRKRT